MKLVEAAFISEFDIDKGSTLKWTVPSPIRGYTAGFIAEHMLPEGAHNRQYEFTVFHLYPDTGADGNIYAEEYLPPAPALPVPTGTKRSSFTTLPSAHVASPDRICLRCVNVARTHKSSDRKRGADVKALAFASRYWFIDQFRPLLAAFLDAFFVEPTRETLVHLVDEINRFPVHSLPVYSSVQRQMLRAALPMHGKSNSQVRIPALTDMSYSTDGKEADENLDKVLHFETHEEYNLLPDVSVLVSVKIPLYQEPSAYHTSSLTTLIRRFGAGFLTIYNALLLEKRVMFMAHKDVPAGEVCNMVLACAHLISPPFSAVQHRLFPYATLQDLSFLNVRGYVAGVTNPIFESKRTWWDVLCYVGPEDFEGRPLGVSGGSTGSASSMFTVSTVPHSLAKIIMKGSLPAIPSTPVAGATSDSFVSTPTAATEETAGTTEETLSASDVPTDAKKKEATTTAETKKADGDPKADTPKSSSGKVVKTPTSATAAQQAAEAAARLSRVVLAYSSALTEDTTPPDISTSTPNLVGLPTVPPLLVPWKDFDTAFYNRLRGALRFGEMWVRDAIQTHTTAILQLIAMQKRIDETPTAEGSSAEVPGNMQLLLANTIRITKLRASAAYAALQEQNHTEEQALAAAAEAGGFRAPDFNKLRTLAGIMRQSGLLCGKASTKLSKPLWDVVKPPPAAIPDGTHSVLRSLPIPDSEVSRFSPAVLSFLSSEPGLSHSASEEDSAAATLLDALDLLDRAAIVAGDSSLIVDEASLHAKLDAATVFVDLEGVLDSPQAQLYFTAQLPDTAGGLAGVALGGLHSDPIVRSLSCTILHRLQSHPWLPVRLAAVRLNGVLKATLARHEPLPKAMAAISSF